MYKNILISGASGFLGQHIKQSLLTHVNRLDGLPIHYNIYSLVRREANANSNEISWDPVKGTIDTKALERVKPDLVIHLAGESALGRWTKSKKEEMLKSRKNGTELLTKALSDCAPPKLFIGASGCSYYGNQGAVKVDESSPKGTGFFSDLVEVWEGAADPLRINNSDTTRVTHMRLGVVIDKSGGYLKNVTLPFKLGLGGVLGSGEQYFPWVSMRDVQGVVKYLMDHEYLTGPFNVTSPYPVTNYELTKTLGRVLFRPTIFTVPRFALNLICGKEMASETLLCDQRVIPIKLMNDGYQFIDKRIEDCLIHQFKSK